MIIDTKYSGRVECEESSVVFFPEGLPGFDDLTRFVCLEQPEFRPLVYLQSVDDPTICFLTLPVGAIDASYRVEVNRGEAALLKLGPAPAVLGRNIVAFAILSTAENRDATANLLSPVLINTAERIGLQVVQSRSQYDWRHPLSVSEPVGVACS